ncbi:CTD small phosphatase-like protein 2-B [Heteronotia binoei]|uniref:CTD small phosphatase-like protein 2-B n=1 Tax=Heteronotia binoei TaxID=13085 RepID=UPI002931F1E2|nr:CTD small phosphatase-like protein 2-B [Heteronotia binoei]
MHSQGFREAPASSTEAYLPIASYFSFSRAENTERLQLSKGKLRSDSLHLRGIQLDVPPKIEALNAFTHPETIQKSQRKKKIPMKTRQTPKNTLVLELEETLAVSSLTAHWEDASTFTVHFQGRHYKVSVKLRPHLEEFLEELARIYEVFIFTAAKQDYADKILKAFGPQRKLIRHQLYQEDCLCSQGCYIKDLSVLERDLARTVAVANCLEAFPYQTSNVILIPKWLGSPRDKELLRLIPVLKRLSQVDNICAEIERKPHGKPTEEA